MSRLTLAEIDRVLAATTSEPEVVTAIRAGLRTDYQVFDFGVTDNIAIPDKTLMHELWAKRLLRMPFKRCVFTFMVHGIRVHLVVNDDVEVAYGDAEPTAGTTLFAIVAQRGDDVRADAVTWFRTATADNIEVGASVLTECENETDLSFRMYTMACVARLMALCMLLNTKGVPKRYEPAPERLNKKRARTGKPPLSAVTYVDLTKVTDGYGGSGKGGEKSMHLRRGHIRHFDDGSITWVRDCIVKADGELKKREKYQVVRKGEVS
jgi:hypothetical protein